MGHSILSSHKSQGILTQQSQITSKASMKKHSLLGFSLNLTTLIDAFCILVIFLLSNMSEQTANINIAKNMKLPEAAQGELLDAAVIVQIYPNEVMIDKQKLKPQEAAAYLTQIRARATDTKKDAKKQDSLMIQADKNSNFEEVGAILRAASQSGFSKIVFAVWPTTK